MSVKSKSVGVNVFLVCALLLVPLSTTHALDSSLALWLMTV